MPIYNVGIHGVAKRLLVRAESAAQAKDQVLSIKALTTEEMAGALADGEKIYTAGDSVLPPVDPEPKLETKPGPPPQLKGGEAATK